MASGSDNKKWAMVSAQFVGGAIAVIILVVIGWLILR